MKHSFSDIDCALFDSAVIIAKNKNNERESNGIGKTTIFNAIEYVLFGEVPSSTLDKIIRHGTEKCVVQIEFKLEDKKYSVRRSRSIKGISDLQISQWENGRWQCISGNRIPENEKLLFDLIKLNHKAFINSIKFAQYDLSGIGSAKKGEKRKEIFKEPLHLSKYTKLAKIANDKRLKIKRKIDKKEVSIQSLGDPKADIEAAQSELTFCKSTIQSKNSTLERLKKTIETKKTTLTNLKNTLDRQDFGLHDKITTLGKKSKELKSRIEKANDRIQKNDKTINENTNKKAELNRLKTKFEEKKQKIESEKLRSPEKISFQLEKLKKDENIGTNLLTKLEVEYDQINKSLPKTDICPHCFQSITSEHRKYFENEIFQKLEEKSNTIKDTNLNLSKCRKKLQRIQAELDEINERDLVLKELNQKICSAETELELRKNNIIEAEQRLFEASEEMKAVQIEHNEVVESLNELKNAAKNSSVPELNQKIFELNDEIRVYDRSSENVQQELSEAQTRQGAAQEKLKTSKENLSKLKLLKKELKKLRKELEISGKGVGVFSPSGIPTFIIHTIIDEFQLEANKWLSRLRPELNFELDKNLEITYRVNSEDQEYDLLSIGQKVYITLAEKLALSRIIQKKLGIDIRFLLWDEVDQSLDNAGIEAFAEVAKELQKEFKLFIITHNESLKEKWNHAILVEGNDNNGTTAKVVEKW